MASASRMYEVILATVGQPSVTHIKYFFNGAS